MPWFWHAEPKPSTVPVTHKPSSSDPYTSPSNRTEHNTKTTPDFTASASSHHEKDIIDALGDPQTLTATLLLTSTILLSIRLYKTRLRRIPIVAFLRPSHFSTTSSSGSTSASSSKDAVIPLTRSKSFLGYVTSSHDPDNFRFYHTPGGRLLLWGTPLRRIPTSRAGLKDNTLSVRIAGIDAPELAHFGKPAQPYGEEALVELKSLVEGRRARIWPLRRDQYERVVCLVMVRRNLFTWGDGWIRGLKEEGWRDFWRKDVGYEMIRRGAATVYEGKFGAEFGGKVREERYREAERAAKELRLGMWKGTSKASVVASRAGVAGSVLRWLGWAPVSAPKTAKVESPREYKQRMAKMEKDASDVKKK